MPDGGNDPVFNRTVRMDDLVRMDWDYFEALVAAIWQKKGFRTVYRTPTRDEGVDVVAFTGQKGDLIHCKSSGTDNALLNDQGVKDVLTGEAEYRLRHPGVSFSKWAATNQYFNDTAHDRARKNNVTLINQLDIEKLLNQHPVTNADVQRFLFVGWEEAA